MVCTLYNDAIVKLYIVFSPSTIVLLIQFIKTGKLAVFVEHRAVAPHKLWLLPFHLEKCQWRFSTLHLRPLSLHLNLSQPDTLTPAPNPSSRART